jgi:hypothetical protein
LSKKPKDLSARESEERGHGEVGGGYVTSATLIQSDTLFGEGEGVDSPQLTDIRRNHQCQLRQSMSETVGTVIPLLFSLFDTVARGSPTSLIQADVNPTLKYSEVFSLLFIIARALAIIKNDNELSL